MPSMSDRPSLPAPSDGDRSERPDSRAALPKLWRNLTELAGAPSISPEEIPPEVGELVHLGRRGFLQVLGGSAAVMGLAACRPPHEKLVPYVHQPVEVTPGTPQAYATAVAIDGLATGVLVTSYQGRPTKVEGNPAHPSSLGAIGTFEQATLLDLYDPGRARGREVLGQPFALRPFLVRASELAASHDADKGARLRFLVGPSSSPLIGDLRRRLLERFPRARFRTWAPLSEDARTEGSRVAFGQPLDPRLHLDKASVVLALDADLFGTDPEALRQSREFTSRRNPGPDLNRLYVAETTLTVTGGFADHRFRMRPSEVLGFGQAIAAALAERHGLAQLRPLGHSLPAGSPHLRAAAAVAADLARSRGKCLVAVGPGQPPAVHALGHALNAALGADGATITYRQPVLHDTQTGPDGLRELAAEIAAGQVDTLVCTAWNPAYSAPADLDFGGLLRKVPHSIYLSTRQDETWARCNWKLGATHPFESWGDARGRDGTASIVQPLLAPLWETTSEAELLSAILGEGRSTYDQVRDLWRSRARLAGPAFEQAWSAWLAQGIVPATAEPVVRATPRWEAIAAAVGAVKLPTGGLEVRFAPDAKVLDGRFAENAWMQELPDPITSLCWDNAAQVSPATAGQLGIDNGAVVKLTCRDRSIEAPVWIVPGHADGAVTLPLGYGRATTVPQPVELDNKPEPLANGIGFDAYRLRRSTAFWFDAGLAVTATGRRWTFAVQQGDFAQEGRPHALSYTNGDWPKQGTHEVEEHRGPQPVIIEPVNYDKEAYKWGMAIDLSRCTGCSACVIACQEENNIPVVGREQVQRRRQMHWLRIDRYFSGTAEDPVTISQPVACVHCESAPCEYVCPVNATVHSDEGLNEMIYNRCVGTRYCSNNCPYKVRRFNFLDYRGEMEPTEKMLMNPDVTVRVRGVMEKCTYCVQRIERSRIQARVEGRPIREGEVKSACQQSCPTEAIAFGNLNDPTSRVAALHRDERRYDLLHDLGTRPRTAYLVRITNPNPELT